MIGKWRCPKMTVPPVIIHIFSQFVSSNKHYIYRRKFRSQTSDNMDRCKSTGAKRQRREEKRRRKNIKKEKESEERRSSAKR
jgi:hypothetical protein